ncbi:hypothetical protein KKA15_07090 [Patescibacteria group bacterium]|nr:hypothetical protein [Patescibacteria group bacterium]
MTFKKNQKAIWKSRILNQQSSGKAISVWCRENNILPRSFYYWRVKVFPKKIDRLNFIELKNTNNSSNDKKNNIVIKYKGAEISVEKGFDITLLQNCLKALQGIRCL